MTRERRKSRRVPMVGTVTVTCDGRKRVEGAVVNVSEKGLCFYADQPLEPGLVAKVEGTFRLERFSRDCTVVWCAEVGTALHKVGISLDTSIWSSWNGRGENPGQ